MEEDDEIDQSKPYSTHYDSSTVHHKINPDCPACLKPVFWSRHILSLDRAWHVQCHTCSYCFKQLGPGEQSFYAGRLYCTVPCFNELFLGQRTATMVVDGGPKLNGENKQPPPPPVPNNITTAPSPAKKDRSTTKDKKQTAVEKKAEIKAELKSKPNHSTCLKCTNCEHLIINHHHLHQGLNDKYPHSKFPGYKENVEMYQRIQKDLEKNLEKSPLQNRNTVNLTRSVHASDFIGQRCVRCLNKVYAAELCYSINFPFHRNCLRCAICDRILQPAAHAVHDGLPICNFPCYNRIYSFGGYRKGWQECKP